MTLEFGLDTFGDITQDAQGRALSGAQVIRNVVAEGVLADQVGLDYIGIGEHHRSDFAISATEPVITAILQKTARIHAGSSVTVLSSDDPIRLYQRFATIDALAPGRAEVTLGRGSFTESFPLFGFALNDYETLFEEKFELFTRLLRDDRVSFTGKHRAPLKGVTIYPRAETPIRTWLGVGGSPESVIRAASHGLPMMLAIIGGDPARFAGHVDLFRRVHAQLGTTPGLLGVHSPGHIGETDETARQSFFAGYKAMHDRIGASRGWPPFRREDFEREIAHGSLYVGGPETVAAKIARTVKILGLQRFTLKYSAGPVSHDSLMRCIELYGTRVAPLVREMLA